jgi:dipeptidyl aminopeptidase/acylaminoacyl peptidase
MRRILVTSTLALAATAIIAASDTDRPFPTPQRATPAPSGPMLTVDSIMRGPKLVGSSPSGLRWSKDSSKLYFTWQKAGDERSSTYVVNRDGSGLRALSTDEARNLDVPLPGRLDRAGRRTLVAEGGDIVIYEVATGQRRFLTRTTAPESSPRWARQDNAVTFQRDGNLFILSLADGALTQLTDIVTPDAPVAGAAPGGRGAGAVGGRGGGAVGGRAGGAGASGCGAGATEAQRWLCQQERDLIEFIRKQAEERQQGLGRGGRGGAAAAGAGMPAPPPIRRFDLTPRQTLADLVLSADERYVYVAVTERPEGTARGQDTPNYITESSFPEMIGGRTNVGDVQSRRLLAVMDLKDDRKVWADASDFAGMERKARPDSADLARLVNWGSPEMSEDGAHALVSVRALDNKDRWLVRVDPSTGKAAIVDHLHDDAWIREMGIGGGTASGAWLADGKRFLFASEKSGYMHLYVMDLSAPKPEAKALTSGKWEVTNAQLSTDRQTIFLTTSEVHPGERHFYSMSVNGGTPTRLTSATGSNDVTISPDEKTLAIIHSYSTKPPELYLMPFLAGSQPTQITTTPSEEWRNFKWIDPKVITYKARDGADVYARLFTPEMIGARRDPRRPAVVFVHGAGYLQNAHKYWSTYYREYMFHNLLASLGYVVLDPDYRASSGYGRDWRTAIYRHMGGHDLNDVVDGAKFLVQTERVDARRIGVYGGSYGGFITLMAMFTTPDVFAAGAALRPVTDWAHYNHGYTSNILNTPIVDAEAYKKSSPIYFADGLKGRLLILHGMVDTNVFFQDSIRLVQRLIELRKENWEITPYPVENHGFTEETSWADEYKRILRAFEETLRK